MKSPLNCVFDRFIEYEGEEGDGDEAELWRMSASLSLIDINEKKRKPEKISGNIVGKGKGKREGKGKKRQDSPQ